MHLVLAVVEDILVTPLQQLLNDKGLRATRVASSGGFLRRGNTTFFIAVEEDQLQIALDTLEEISKKRPERAQLKVKTTVFVARLDDFQRI